MFDDWRQLSLRRLTQRETETSSPDSSGSTSYLRARAKVDPRSLSAQLTCEWFVEGLDFCCPYWRYQFKRPLTPPPAPPPSPDASRKRTACHCTCHRTKRPQQHTTILSDDDDDDLDDDEVAEILAKEERRQALRRASRGQVPGQTIPSEWPPIETTLSTQDIPTKWLLRETALSGEVSGESS